MQLGKKNQRIEELEEENGSLTAKLSMLTADTEFITQMQQQDNLPECATKVAEEQEAETAVEAEKTEDISKKLQLHQPESFKTVVYDNWDECQKQIQRIKNTAEICIHNYKVSFNNVAAL